MAASLPSMVCSPWQEHSKHIFVLTAAGKPIFSRHGSEGDATSIMTVVSAVVGRTLDTADPIKVINAGNTLFVFSLRGPFILVAVSRTGETVHTLSEQLRAIHSTIILTLTSRIEARLRERPGLDVRQSLGGPGTRSQFLNVVRNCNRYPTLWLDAIPILTLPASVKSRITSILSSASQKAASSAGLVYAILFAGTTVVAWAQTRNKEYSLKPHDAFLLSNAVQSSAALRLADSWIPVCLPSLDDSGFLHAFISYLGAVNVPMSMSSATAQHQAAANANATAASAQAAAPSSGASTAGSHLPPRASMPPASRPGMLHQQQSSQGSVSSSSGVSAARPAAVSSPATASSGVGSTPKPMLSSEAVEAGSHIEPSITSLRERGETAYSDDEGDDDEQRSLSRKSSQNKGTGAGASSLPKSMGGTMMRAADGGLGLSAVDPLVPETANSTSNSTSGNNGEIERAIDAALENYESGLLGAGGKRKDGGAREGDEEEDAGDDDDDDDSVAPPPAMAFPALASPRHRPSISLVTPAGRSSRAASSLGLAAEKGLSREDDDDDDDKDGPAGGLLLEQTEEEQPSPMSLPTSPQGKEAQAPNAGPPPEAGSSSGPGSRSTLFNEEEGARGAASAGAAADMMRPSQSNQSIDTGLGTLSSNGEDEEQLLPLAEGPGYSDDEDQATSAPSSPVRTASNEGKPAAAAAAGASPVAAPAAATLIKSPSDQPASSITAAKPQPSAATGAAAAAAVHIAHEPPALFLALVSSEGSGAHVEALAARKQALAAQLHESQSIAYVMRALAAAHVGGPGPMGPAGSGGVGTGGPAGWLLSAAGAAFSTSSGGSGSHFVGPGIGGGIGDFSPAAYGIQGLLHFVYVWKPWRQYTMSRFASCLAEYSQRKALLRAYQVIYDRLTATSPPLRHAVSTFGGWEGVIGHLAGIHTTSAIMLCAFDPTIPADKVTVLTEKLAKAVKKDHDKLLLPSPGVL